MNHHPTPNSAETRTDKRERFALAMMQGLVSGYSSEDKVNVIYIPECYYNDLAKMATQLADALLNQLNNKQL